MRLNVQVVLAVAALGLGLGCGSKLTGPSDGGPGGAACSGDNDCASGLYCLGFTQRCAGVSYAYTVGVGTCHRDCSSGACSCVENADCRAWGDCSSGQCLAVPVLCIAQPSSCPAGCTFEQAPDSVCGPVCRCAVCPAADASLD
jgi:hypothetical protein